VTGSRQDRLDAWLFLPPEIERDAPALLALLDDAYLREIADYFAALDLPYPPPRAPAEAASILAAGEALVRRGDPARSIPARRTSRPSSRRKLRPSTTAATRPSPCGSKAQSAFACPPPLDSARNAATMAR